MLQQVHRPWYSKCYSYKWQPKVFKTGPEFFSEWSSQKQFGDFWNFENFNSQFLPMRRPKTSIIWIMRDRRAKQDKSWESQALSTTYMGYIYLVAFKVILGWRSFGALVILKMRYSKSCFFLQIPAKVYQTSPKLSSQQP